jgi:pimeloyl-ACP methyl ester carboxylesterase
MKIVYIHGASASSDSFNYIRDHLKHNDELLIDYNSSNGFENNLADMKEKIANIGNIFFICHSLGGIYALHLADAFPENVLGAVTLSTPYGGAESADYAKYFLPFSKLLKDIGPNSKPFRTADNIEIKHPWTNVVTTRGDSPWILQANDGVVTVRSMTRRNDMRLIELYTNHYEVVINPEVVKIIKKEIKNLNNN